MVKAFRAHLVFDNQDLHLNRAAQHLRRLDARPLTPPKPVQPPTLFDKLGDGENDLARQDLELHAAK